MKGIRQSLQSTFVLDKTRGFKEICEPDRKQYKKTALSNVKIYLEIKKNGKVIFIGETMTFNLIRIKIYFFRLQNTRNISHLFLVFPEISSKKFKTYSCCHGSLHCTSTVGIEGDTAKTGHKLLIGECVKSNRKKSRIAVDKTIQTKRLDFFLKTLEDIQLKQMKIGRKQNETFSKSVEDWCKNSV